MPDTAPPVRSAAESLGRLDRRTRQAAWVPVTFVALFLLFAVLPFMLVSGFDGFTAAAIVFVLTIVALSTFMAVRRRRSGVGVAAVVGTAAPVTAVYLVGWHRKVVLDGRFTMSGVAADGTFIEFDVHADGSRASGRVSSRYNEWCELTGVLTDGSAAVFNIYQYPQLSLRAAIIAVHPPRTASR